MNKKWLHLTVVLLFLVSVFLPATNAYAATGTCRGGQSCYNKFADQTTFVNSSGQDTGILCSADALTVYYGGGPYSKSGTNGTVYVELRWSSRCTANWTRGTISTANSNSRQLGLKASPSNSGYYTTKYTYSASGYYSGYYDYTKMVDGRYTVTATAGINSTSCSGTNNTGFPCNYNPLASYAG